MLAEDTARALRRVVLLAAAFAWSGVCFVYETMAEDATGTAEMTAQKACIDPATGRVVPPEQSPGCKEALQRSQEESAGTVNQSAEGLKEEPLPHGGSKMDLKGRFQQEGVTGPSSPAPQGGGQVAIIDPQTGSLMTGEAATLMRRQGELRPGGDEFERQLRTLLMQSEDVSGLQEQQLEGGAVLLDLGGRFQIPLVARIGPDGNVVIKHATLAED
jgi:hypothetical protein